MAAAFIGLSVKVLLNNGMSLKGHVADVDQITQRLMLQDGEAALSLSTLQSMDDRDFPETNHDD